MDLRARRRFPFAVGSRGQPLAFSGQSPSGGLEGTRVSGSAFEQLGGISAGALVSITERELRIRELPILPRGASGIRL